MGILEGTKASGGKLVGNPEFLVRGYENPGHSAGFLGFYGVIRGV